MNLSDDVMAEILIGSYMGLTTLLMVNIFIALLTSTFTRVHESSKAYFVLQRATEIIRIENKMNPQDKYKHLMVLSRDYVDKGYSGFNEMKKLKADAFDTFRDSLKLIREEVTDLSGKLEEMQDEIVFEFIYLFNYGKKAHKCVCVLIENVTMMYAFLR